MLFKSKQDEETIKRAQAMYGQGINRGLAGFVPNRKKKRQSQAAARPTVDRILLTTTETLPGQDYTIIDPVCGITSQAQNALADLGASGKQPSGGELKTRRGAYQPPSRKRLRAAAKAKGADAVVGMRFDSAVATVNGSQVQTVVAYGTAVKFE